MDRVLEPIFDRVWCGVLLLDDRARIVQLNRAAVSMLGTDAVGKKLDAFGAEGEDVLGALEDRLAGEGRIVARGVVLRAGGQTVDVFVDQLKDTVAGAHALATLVDVSARAALESEIARLRDRL